MRVKLAVQTFSTSVADAIEILRKWILARFKDSEATVNFYSNIE